jgi:hypothetical protein
MSRKLSSSFALLALSLGMGSASLPSYAETPVTLSQYEVVEGLNINSFVRQGPVSAHILLRSGFEPRLLVAFPAGNSGVGLWFNPLSEKALWTQTEKPSPHIQNDAKGRPLYGVMGRASINAPELSLKAAILSNVRILRDYQAIHKYPASVAVSPKFSGNTIVWARDRLDGAAGYVLSLEVINGSIKDERIIAGPDGVIRLKYIALSGEPPLTPLGGPDLLNAKAAPDVPATNALTFLSYKEKFLAGSWRFNTYFGRDTLMSVRLLMPVLQPQAIEAGLGSVLERLDVTGEVAHEEDIGEFAVLENQRLNGTLSDTPLFNQHMVDDDYMLAPVVQAWLLEDARGRKSAKAFLAKGDHGSKLVNNLRFVIQSSKPFATSPKTQHLIGLKSGFMAGQWRDSNEGLGRGQYAYDVNTVFVPAALEAADKLFKSGLLTPYLTKADAVIFAQAAKQSTVWHQYAPPLFDVSLSQTKARKDITAYAKALNVSDKAALASLGKGPVTFQAIALSSEGKALPIVHSDEGFELLFGHPEPQRLNMAINAMMRPFPAGLMTDVGLLVANPVFSDPEVEARFDKTKYHGTVVWSWQQAVLAEGLARQLKRKDLGPKTRANSIKAQTTLWTAIQAAKSVQSSELWSWDYKKGRYVVAPFGASGGDEDESNAAQLWSTVYLAIPKP